MIFWPVDGEIVVLELDRRTTRPTRTSTASWSTAAARACQVTEVPERRPGARARRSPAARPRRRSVEPERENPLTVFTTPQLQQIGLDGRSDRGRSARSRPSVEVGDALAELGPGGRARSSSSPTCGTTPRATSRSSTSGRDADARRRADRRGRARCSACARQSPPTPSPSSDARDFELVLRGLDRGVDVLPAPVAGADRHATRPTARRACAAARAPARRSPRCTARATWSRAGSPSACC